MERRGNDPVALVLAGAVAKGAFEAGVTRELARRDLCFDRFVGASAGALNATILAAGAAAGRLGDAAERLVALWRDRAWIWSFLRPTIAPGGVSSTRAVEALVVEALRDVTAPRSAGAAVATKLTLVTTDVRGTMYEGELTHEDEHTFDERALLDERQWRHIARVAAASAAFPFLFAPPRLADEDGEEGQRVDGGVVNNTPLSYAIDGDATGRGHRSIVVVTAEPKELPPRRSLFSVPLGARLVEILVNERISRDLVVAKKRNEKRRRLVSALKGTVVDAEALADRLGFRELDIVPIHPRGELAGGAFGGFFWKGWRRRQIADGEAAAREAFASRDEPFPKPARGASSEELSLS